MSDGTCLVCGQHGPIEDAHWPFAVGMGRKRRRVVDLPTVPLCHECHTKAHWAERKTVDALTAKAPGYWRSIGEYEQHRERWETWLSRRRTIAALNA